MGNLALHLPLLIQISVCGWKQFYQRNDIGKNNIKSHNFLFLVLSMFFYKWKFWHPLIQYTLCTKACDCKGPHAETSAERFWPVSIKSALACGVRPHRFSRHFKAKYLLSIKCEAAYLFLNFNIQRLSHNRKLQDYVVHAFAVSSNHKALCCCH